MADQHPPSTYYRLPSDGLRHELRELLNRSRLLEWELERLTKRIDAIRMQLECRTDPPRRSSKQRN